MEKFNDNPLWRPYDEKGTLLRTGIPNCLLESIIEGDFTLVETRIILFISRMTFGFRREETNYLGLEDFASEIDLNKSNISKAIKGLLKEKIIFRNMKNGNKYKYAVNLFWYGARMKHYKISKDWDNEINNALNVEGNADYLMGNSGVNEGYVIIYNPKGYDNNEIPYI